MHASLQYPGATERSDGERKTCSAVLARLSYSQVHLSRAQLY